MYQDHLGLDVSGALLNTFVIEILKINWDCSYHDVIGLKGWYSVDHSSKNSFTCSEFQVRGVVMGRHLENLLRQLLDSSKLTQLYFPSP